MKTRSVYSVIKRDVSEEEIINQKLFNVFVFGLPRSGTSMMTHICELLGVKMFHTTEKKKREYKHLGAEYHPNATGFYEVTEDLLKHYFEIVGTPYSGCKMIIPVRRERFDLVKLVPAKVIMMWREPEEIRQSQNAFYAKNADLAYIRTALVQEKLKLKENNIDHIIVQYRDVIKNPHAEILKIKDFILSERDIDEAVSFVNPNAYRFDKDKIVEGV